MRKQRTEGKHLLDRRKIQTEGLSDLISSTKHNILLCIRIETTILHRKIAEIIICPIVKSDSQQRIPN